MTKSIFFTAPDPTLKLVHNDVWLPGLYSRRILCFSLASGSSHETAIDVIQRGLQALVQGTPELGGTSIVIQNAAPHDAAYPWREIVPGQGIELVTKDLTTSFASYDDLERTGFPLSSFKDDELMPIEGPIMPEPAAIARFQLNLIEGGVLLSCCIYHHLTDGNGMNAIIRALAEECKRAGKAPGGLPPRVLDSNRAALSAANGSMTDLKHHPAYSILKDAFVPVAHHDEAPPEVNGEEPPPPPQFQPHYYYLSNDNAQALKDYGSRDTPVSTHDAISAAIWRNLIISRLKTGELKDTDQVTSYSIPHNARKYLGLPNTWVGNCTYFILAQATVSEVVAEDSLPILASRIRAAMKEVDTEHVKGILAVRKQDPYSLNWWPIMQVNGPHLVGMTSFYHSELMGTDWGKHLGEPKHFTCTDLGGFATQFQRAHFVGPRLPGGRACYVHVGLVKPEVEHYRADPAWNKYFQLKEITEHLSSGRK
ncbi:Putative transferase [Septoria linicola]|uniref:Transferase n=1 Tax=Septoria linicola TaxID=215465 RepID=A0A9Q9EJ44_9PEZI|nr:putative transferase [Septoria linicola]USW52650.1 Putative transferase [Septoria linicola]